MQTIVRFVEDKRVYTSVTSLTKIADMRCRNPRGCITVFVLFGFRLEKIGSHICNHLGILSECEIERAV